MQRIKLNTHFVRLKVCCTVLANDKRTVRLLVDGKEHIVDGIKVLVSKGDVLKEGSIIGICMVEFHSTLDKQMFIDIDDKVSKKFVSLAKKREYLKSKLNYGK